MWYVVQVFTGKENETVSNIKRLVPQALYKECFNPTYQVQKRVNSMWKTVECPLFPGYVIVDSENPKELAMALQTVPGYTHILGSDEDYTPLPQEEQQWINEFTQVGSRVIGLSSGVIEGDKVIVLQGPLVNRTAWIKKIDRHKRLAWLELDLCGRKVIVKVGLSIVRKYPEQRGAAEEIAKP